ncbi:hypothetical protein AWZ03_008535 [Drosophila navojoa]|uniref:Uncharacterized protein n=1 Tax=Drosophila navojoa TaxID=7232 RepID=A0A484B8Q5_DRONA|nr:uncharacterized protein LOC115563256 [Drosophila navojoa]TDG45034.1 hypothetical protein AWZ03_008535 [Drosophila navojoa]
MANIENASETLPTTTSVPNHISTDLIDLITYKPSEEEIVENGGHQISLPGGKNQGIRHVHAHDGFHNVKRERHWANWNNALKSKKTTEPSI